MHRLLSISLFFLSVLTMSGESEDRKNYIQTYKDAAIEQMNKYGIPASITLAQGILESGNGKSMLTREANNHFGIKCHGWDGPGVYHDDDKRNECFRKYRTAAESFEDHSKFLLKKRYAALFDLKPTDYKGWAHGLKKAGYATDPAYAKRLISLIEANDLTQYDDRDAIAQKRFRESAKPSKTNRSTQESTDVIDLTRNREVLTHPNRIKFIRAQKDDDVRAIAQSLEMSEWQLKKYNDLDGRVKFKEGEVVFLQPKRSKSKVSYHKATNNETLRDISANYGVKLKSLKKYNPGVGADGPLEPGQKVHLRKPKG